MHIETNTESPTRTPGQRSLDLNALSRMTVRELGELFAKGQVPERLSALDGHPRGRMLAVRGLDRGHWLAGLRAFAGGARFPWGGKSFSADSRTQGAGINRVHLGGRHQLFPFKTHFGPSVIDGSPAVILDYDLADNPRVIRAIHDEVRLVDDGLYLGPAMWKTEREPVFVLWFALDTLSQAVPIGERAPS
jgi:hypothetical protein